MWDSLIRHIPAEVSSTYRLYIYGSGINEPAMARDIDVLLTSPAVAAVIAREFRVADFGDVPVHLHLVPERTMLADIEEWTAGGFYAHKYALGALEIAAAGDAVDMAATFWKSEITRGPEYGHSSSRAASEVIARCHAKILYFRPTFARALAKFAVDRHRRRALAQYVATILEASVADSSIRRREDIQFEAAMFRFWREYNDLKSLEVPWSAAAVHKMINSLSPDTLAVAVRYLRRRGLTTLTP